MFYYHSHQDVHILTLYIHIDGDGLDIVKIDSDANVIWTKQYPQSYFLYNPVALSPDGSLIAYQEMAENLIIVTINTTDGTMVNNATYPTLGIQTELYEGVGASMHFSPSNDYLFFTATLLGDYWTDAEICKVDLADFSTVICKEFLGDDGNGTVAGFDVINDNEIFVNYVVRKFCY